MATKKKCAPKCASKCASKKTAAKATAKTPAKKAEVKVEAKATVPTKKGEILAEIASKAGIDKAQASKAYDALLEIAYQGAKLEGGITLPGLGKLSVGDRAARQGRNPTTGETVEIAAKKIAKFKFVKAAKDAIAGE